MNKLTSLLLVLLFAYFASCQLGCISDTPSETIEDPNLVLSANARQQFQIPAGKTFRRIQARGSLKNDASVSNCDACAIGSDGYCVRCQLLDNNVLEVSAKSSLFCAALAPSVLVSRIEIYYDDQETTTTAAPETAAPTTAAPTTAAPETVAPTTAAPETSAPVTSTTLEPTTSTTSAPIETQNPTTTLPVENTPQPSERSNANIIYANSLLVFLALLLIL